MIACPECNHANPSDFSHCQACGVSLISPADQRACPSCGAAVLAAANFCGQCGFSLHNAGTVAATAASPAAASPAVSQRVELPDPDLSDLGLPLDNWEESFDLSAEDLPAAAQSPGLEEPLLAPEDDLAVPAVLADAIALGVAAQPEEADFEFVSEAIEAPPAAAAPPPEVPTQLQQRSARLLHIQTNTIVELPHTLSSIHLGKPNDRCPPDIDVSGFPNAEVVSRVHASLRVRDGEYYLEDNGSANGTYINQRLLPKGDLHRMESGDRISLGKHDLMSFLFQRI